MTYLSRSQKRNAMFKRIFFLGLSAGIVAAAAALIYSRIHFFATYADFSRIINPASLVGINLAIGLFAAIGYWLFKIWFKSKGQVIFNLTFSIISFASIMIPFAFTLPLDIQYPELFPGLTIPMHFFPVLAWHTLQPIFISTPATSIETKERSLAAVVN